MSNDTIGTTLNTPQFRAAYLSVFQSKLNKLNNKEEYSVVALFKPGTDLTPLKKAVEAAVRQRWGNDPAKWPKDIRLPFRKHEEREKDGQLPAGHEPGGIFCTFKTAVNPRMPKPAVFDQRNKRIEESEQHRVYSGCWMIANVTAGAYPKPGVTGVKPGVTFYLNGLQLVRDDEPIAGRPSVEKAFQPVEGFEAETSSEAGAGGLFDSLT